MQHTLRKICANSLRVATNRLSAVLVFLLALLAGGQAAATGWAENFGGANGSGSYASATAVDSAGNAYAVGHFVSDTLRVGHTTQSNSAYKTFMSPSWMPTEASSGQRSLAGSGRRQAAVPLRWMQVAMSICLRI